MNYYWFSATSRLSDNGECWQVMAKSLKKALKKLNITNPGLYDIQVHIATHEDAIREVLAKRERKNQRVINCVIRGTAYQGGQNE